MWLASLGYGGVKIHLSKNSKKKGPELFSLNDGKWRAI